MIGQQTLNLKNEKKAFTLVELIVVIAILAILAAVAIPIVISIIHSSADSKGKEDTQTLTTACYEFYIDVISGTINSSNFTPADGSTIKLPLVNDTSSNRQSGAKSATIADVLKYNELAETILDDKLYVTQDNGNYKKGNIIYSTDTIDKTAPLTKTVSLDKLYG